VLNKQAYQKLLADVVEAYVGALAIGPQYGQDIAWIKLQFDHFITEAHQEKSSACNQKRAAIKEAKASNTARKVKDIARLAKSREERRNWLDAISYDRSDKSDVSSTSSSSSLSLADLYEQQKFNTGYQSK